MTSLQTVLRHKNWDFARNAYRNWTMRRLSGMTVPEAGKLWQFAMESVWDQLPLCPILWHALTLGNAQYTEEFGEEAEDDIPDSLAQKLMQIQWPNPVEAPCIPQEHTQSFWSLHSVPRTGWTRTIPAFYPDSPTAASVENVAEHSLKTMLLAHAISPEDPAVLRMALIHDLGEILIGDLTPAQVSSRSQKHAREQQAFETLLTESDLSTQHKTILSADYAEYQSAQTPRARIIRIADKLDMALQAMTYQTLFHLSLSEFLVSAAQDIRDNTLPFPPI